MAHEQWLGKALGDLGAEDPKGSLVPIHNYNRNHTEESY